MKVLILGAGQLARMMYLAGAPLGIEVQAVDVVSLNVLQPVSKSLLDISLEQAIDQADAISVEFEHIPEDLLRLCEQSGKLKPSMQAILVGADRVREKQLLEQLTIANCEHEIVDDVEQMERVIQQLGLPLVIKASRDGYDGYGQWRLKTLDELPSLKQQLSELDLSAVPLVVEKMVQFERELSLVGVRSHDGEVRCYPLAHNQHYQGQLHLSISPAENVSENLQKKAEHAFAGLVEELDYVGVLAVEFFQLGDELLVNEIAPRVHNSGHWSQQGADTCQFENHLRAIIELPIGSTQPNGLTAMVNIIGVGDVDNDVLAIPNCHLHWYGKSVRAKRKMGHINLRAASSDELDKALAQLKYQLPAEYFPLL